MIFRIVFLFVVIMTEVLASLEDGQCCPPNQAILRRKVMPYYCWDPKTNATSYVSVTCNETAMIMRTKDMDFHVDTTGQLVLELPNVVSEYEPGTFCVGNVGSLKDVNLTKTVFIGLLCYEEDVKVISETAVGYCMVTSSVFLMITAVIYLGLAELRDLQGKSIINFCLSLSIGLGILAAMKLMTYSNMHLCAARGFLTYFFIIASFFWTNAISIQVLLSVRRPTVLNYGWREFIYYAIYAWGSPTLLTTNMAIVNYAPGDHQKPGIGLNHCWFFNKKQQWQYMYSVMSILIAVNICIFIYTSIQLWRYSFSSTHVKALKFKFAMTVRLFIVMGVAWIFEMIGSLVGSHIVWEILDVVNSLQGVLIFLVLVVFRRRTIKAMHQHGWLDCISGPIERFLAVGEDEEDVVQHTIGVTMEEPKK